MNANHVVRRLLPVLVTALLWACSGDDTGDNGRSGGTALSVSVTQLEMAGSVAGLGFEPQIVSVDAGGYVDFHVEYRQTEAFLDVEYLREGQSETAAEQNVLGALVFVASNPKKTGVYEAVVVVKACADKNCDDVLDKQTIDVTLNVSGIEVSLDDKPLENDTITLNKPQGLKTASAKTLAFTAGDEQFDSSWEVEVSYDDLDACCHDVSWLVVSETNAGRFPARLTLAIDDAVNESASLFTAGTYTAKLNLKSEVENKAVQVSLVVEAPPEAPVLTTPAADEMHGTLNAVDFAWEPVEGVDYYELEVASHDDFEPAQQVLLETPLTEAQVNLLPPAEGVMFWRVRSVVTYDTEDGAKPLAGLWSDARRLGLNMFYRSFGSWRSSIRPMVAGVPYREGVLLAYDTRETQVINIGLDYVDRHGNVLNSKHITNSVRLATKDMITTADGGVLVLAEGDGVFVIKLNADLIEQWRRQINVADPAEPAANLVFIPESVVDHGNGYLISGRGESEGPALIADSFMLMLDENGDVVGGTRENNVALNERVTVDTSQLNLSEQDQQTVAAFGRVSDVVALGDGSVAMVGRTDTGSYVFGATLSTAADGSNSAVMNWFKRFDHAPSETDRRALAGQSDGIYIVNDQSVMWYHHATDPAQRRQWQTAWNTVDGIALSSFKSVTINQDNNGYLHVAGTLYTVDGTAVSDAGLALVQLDTLGETVESRLIDLGERLWRLSGIHLQANGSYLINGTRVLSPGPVRAESGDFMVFRSGPDKRFIFK